ncbi:MULTISPECIES: hydroxymyristoyl-ACP dehydratase [unclassified Leeuwenhoekiella]|uniref:3-hydroxyacyl-ACP dehydratase FabZ family protein n=1 Tax=unclassified Leeuwenhoekiella TaxID=2615029 RepID=UPI000C617AEE|nr:MULTISPECIES: hydroxymyristoyl-ACP dehydratase [unclassified Leeuwenhoekiella]MAW95275.1 hydroxymyristoyl-ACP dehydratase [Leeuwenhoekiella sp.]MBA81802.1 hydroxymyristoyl-ACP dehydratase [Leeuwenhoekiella sp.]|tara:strand:- start:2879 stop:3334 length:456 start_codon:yes stop_codon:yes gene_type:complete
MTKEEIVAKLPYADPFLFVDRITEVSQTHIKGEFTFKDSCDFYKGHFVNFPVTPGVLLLECMMQIGLVSLGIYLLRDKGFDLRSNSTVAMVENEARFYKPVFPNETVTIESDLEYFRFHKLKSKVKMLNQNGEVVCQGIFSGILKPGDAES